MRFELNAEVPIGDLTDEDVLPYICYDFLLAAALAESTSQIGRKKGKDRARVRSMDRDNAQGGRMVRAREVLRAFVKRWGAVERTKWVQRLGDSRTAKCSVEYFSASERFPSDFEERIRGFWTELGDEGSTVGKVNGLEF